MPNNTKQEPRFSKTLPLNGVPAGKEKPEETFGYNYWGGLEAAIAEYVASKMEEHNHPSRFTAKELRLADWMVTQSGILLQTEYCSLDEVAERAERIYSYKHK